MVDLRSTQEGIKYNRFIHSVLTLQVIDFNKDYHFSTEMTVAYNNHEFTFFLN